MPTDSPGDSKSFFEVLFSIIKNTAIPSLVALVIAFVVGLTKNYIETSRKKVD